MPEPHELSDPRRPSPEGREGGWEGGTRPAVAGNVWRTRAGGARFSLRTFRHGRAAPSARTPESAVAAGAGVGGRDGRREQATWASEEGEIWAPALAPAAPMQSLKHRPLNGVEAFQAEIWSIDFHRCSFLWTILWVQKDCAPNRGQM